MSSTPEQTIEPDSTEAEFNRLVQEVREELEAHAAILRLKMAARIACPDTQLSEH